MEIRIEIDPEQAWRAQAEGDPMMAELTFSLFIGLQQKGLFEGVGAVVRMPSGMPFATWYIEDTEGL